MPVQDFLNQRSVNVTVDGSYTLPNWYDPQGKLRTFACRTTRVSPFRMIVEVPVVGKVGDRLTSYFRDFGKFEGSISDTMERSFLLELEMSRARREKLSDMLIWLEKKQKNPAIKCIRKDARFVPPNHHSTLTLADGSVHPCFIIDMSVSGVAVSSPVQPPIGMPLAVGACIGRVVRLLPNGIAIQFIERQNSRALERLTARVVQTGPAADPGASEPAASGDVIAV
ncbi:MULTISPECIES: PilZ domain-containing protein [Bradyrhizobium]|uniref:PilZ domain-containing protein n=2 Tax=Bradyrhizobium TaxID=374 RepID=A0ABY0PVN2_9BRAD|nr:MULTISPECIES: PilZ domain-containing protein [Bradyrhizobium]SDJ02054.1 PilZ domain-containing protein [Bradyrhizobium ottawaense]SED00636.1 PilZ domain-containing protein [Bradyrhizobium lablabi]SHL07734.1 PilZ domain-containing protein [Bradyrhizobium lablabi]